MTKRSKKANPAADDAEMIAKLDEQTRQKYMTPDNLALIDATKAMADKYVKTVEASDDDLKLALAKVFTVAMVFKFESWPVSKGHGAHMLLTDLGVKPNKDSNITKPILKLVHCLFGSMPDRHRSQHTRYAKVIEFLMPSSDELHRLQSRAPGSPTPNHTPDFWSEHFLTKYTEHDGIKAILRAQQLALKPAKQAVEKKLTEKRKRDRREQKREREKFLMTPNVRFDDVEGVGNIVGNATLVILGKDEDGKIALFKLTDNDAVMAALINRATGWHDEKIPASV